MTCSWAIHQCLQSFHIFDIVQSITSTRKSATRGNALEEKEAKNINAWKLTWLQLDRRDVEDENFYQPPIWIHRTWLFYTNATCKPSSKQYLVTAKNKTSVKGKARYPNTWTLCLHFWWSKWSFNITINDALEILPAKIALYGYRYNTFGV